MEIKSEKKISTVHNCLKFNGQLLSLLKSFQIQKNKPKQIKNIIKIFAKLKKLKNHDFNGYNTIIS